MRSFSDGGRSYVYNQSLMWSFKPPIERVLQCILVPFDVLAEASKLCVVFRNGFGLLEGTDLTFCRGHEALDPRISLLSFSEGVE